MGDTCRRVRRRRSRAIVQTQHTQPDGRALERPPIDVGARIVGLCPCFEFMLVFLTVVDEFISCCVAAAKASEPQRPCKRAGSGRRGTVLALIGVRCGRGRAYVTAVATTNSMQTALQPTCQTPSSTTHSRNPSSSAFFSNVRRAFRL